jgi:hypothetical protein
VITGSFYLAGQVRETYTPSMKRVLILLFLLLPFFPAAAQEKEGDEKIEDTIRKIEEEEEEEEQQQQTEKLRRRPKKNEDSEDDGLGDLLWDIFWEVFIRYAASIRFAPYPYAPTSDFSFSTVVIEPDTERKFISLQASSDISVHFDDTYGNVNRLSAQLSAFHFNLYQQNIFSRSQSLSFFSVNGGLSILIRCFDLTAFAGAYKVTTTDKLTLSIGWAVRLFLPGKIYLDLYNLYGFLNDVARFRHLILSLNYSIWRFSVGAGYNYNNIVGDVYAGPCLKFSFWL